MYRSWLLIPPEGANSTLQRILERTGNKNINYIERPGAGIEYIDKHFRIYLPDPSSFFKACQGGLRVFSVLSLNHLNILDNMIIVHEGFNYKVSWSGREAHYHDDPYNYRMFTIEEIGSYIRTDLRPQACEILPCDEENIPDHAKLYVDPQILELSDADISMFINAKDQINGILLPAIYNNQTDYYFMSELIRLRQNIARIIGIPEEISIDIKDDIYEQWPGIVILTRLADNVLIRNILRDGGSIGLKYRDGAPASMVLSICHASDIGRYRGDVIMGNAYISRALREDIQSVLPRNANIDIADMPNDWSIDIARTEPIYTEKQNNIKALNGIIDSLSADDGEAFNAIISSEAITITGVDPSQATNNFIHYFWKPTAPVVSGENAWRYSIDTILELIKATRIIEPGQIFDQVGRWNELDCSKYSANNKVIKCTSSLSDDKLLRLRLLVPLDTIISSEETIALGVNTYLNTGFILMK